MKYVDEFRNPQIAERLVTEIQSEVGRLGRVTLMEVCGTHTMSIFRYGIRSLLPGNIRLLSGPGCPVCVTPKDFLDCAIGYGRQPGVTLATFGDMMRVPGSHSSLEREKAAGADVRIVYSAMDALEMAACLPDRTVVFLGVGFETTAPTIAASIAEAQRRGLENYAVLSGHKLVPPAMEALTNNLELSLDGFICPPHVSAIIGTRGYEVLGVPCVVTGFEPLDILQGVLMLVRQFKKAESRVEIQYRRVVTAEGNPAAVRLMEEIFEPRDSEWRGLGRIAESGLAIRAAYRQFDMRHRMPLDVAPPVEDRGCRCGDVLRGLIRPPQCRLFGKQCTPEDPVGACMVSSEGTCAAYFKYGDRDEREAQIEP
jgi:hydrogenase expression/formation protein HypD